MNNKSTYRHLINVDPTIKTAIIYSIDELFAYTVEIKEGDHSYYLTDKGEARQFGNMENARQAAVKENAQEAYLALSKTYEEPDLQTCHANHQERYDYNKIPLHLKK
jgi:hypothetical protein